MLFAEKKKEELTFIGDTLIKTGNHLMSIMHSLMGIHYTPN